MSGGAKVGVLAACQLLQNCTHTARCQPAKFPGDIVQFVLLPLIEFARLDEGVHGRVQYAGNLLAVTGGGVVGKVKVGSGLGWLGALVALLAGLWRRDEPLAVWIDVPSRLDELSVGGTQREGDGECELFLKEWHAGPTS